MARHNFDPTVYDYSWKQARLSKEKELLKSGLTSLISKTPRENTKKILEEENTKKVLEDPSTKKIVKAADVEDDWVVKQ